MSISILTPKVTILKVFTSDYSHLNRSRPLLTSCLTYGSLTGLAELSQQTLQSKVNFFSIQRHFPFQLNSLNEFPIKDLVIFCQIKKSPCYQ